jgi:hypothetical protein
MLPDSIVGIVAQGRHCHSSCCVVEITIKRGVNGNAESVSTCLLKKGTAKEGGATTETLENVIAAIELEEGGAISSGFTYKKALAGVCAVCFKAIGYDGELIGSRRESTSVRIPNHSQTGQRSRTRRNLNGVTDNSGSQNSASPRPVTTKNSPSRTIVVLNNNTRLVIVTKHARNR